MHDVALMRGIQRTGHLHHIADRFTDLDTVQSSLEDIFVSLVRKA